MGFIFHFTEFGLCCFGFPSINNAEPMHNINSSDFRYVFKKGRIL